MTKSWMKLLAIPALLAGVVQGFGFTNNIPVNAYYQPGTELMLTWTPEARTDTFELHVFSFLVHGIYISPQRNSPYIFYDYNSSTVVLGKAVSFTTGNYTWLIELIDGRAGPDWYYAFSATWYLRSTCPRAFSLSNDTSS
ncbi:hypothetical protein GGR58DRAFT_498237 [Xylaria digitata]|nr:hypothetical protein GGR58DRAFT_498237 [Xylaria digitata]